MNKKAIRSYDKAMSYYEEGNINKALELCEDILAEGLDNPSVLNFKGLLLYQQGKLNEAITVWRINDDLNNDEIAQNYIKDAEADEGRIYLFKQAEKALKEFEVDKALELFKECAESDFNSIKVNEGIAMCYKMKYEFIKAREYVDKALSIDKNSVIAISIAKELKDNDIFAESRKSFSKLMIGIILIFSIFIIVVGGYITMERFKNKNSEVIDQTEKEATIIDDNKSEDVKPEKESVDSSATASNQTVNDKTTFNKEKVKSLISNNDFDGIYEQLKNVKKESITGDDTEVYDKAVNLMKDQGVSKFYEYGLWYFNQGNYSEAKTSLDKAYTYSEGSSIKEHILFYRASNSAKQSDYKSALSQFEEYYKQYPKGVYAQEALYELALLNNGVEKEKSKVYANILMKDYPSSIYVNDNIKNILKN